MGLQKFIVNAQASGELPPNFSLTSLDGGDALKAALVVEAQRAIDEAHKATCHAGKRLGLLVKLANVPDGINSLTKLDTYLGIDERDMWGDYLHLQNQD